MNIKTEGNTMIMSESLVCKNFSDMKHFGDGFEKVSDNEYKCNTCGATLLVKEPILVHDDKGRLKMQVAVEPLPRERGRDVMPATSGTPLSPYRNDPDRNPPTSFKEDKFA